MLTAMTEKEQIEQKIYNSFNLEILNTNAPICIFGTKQMGQQVFRCLKNAGREISCFMDNNKELTGKTLFDKLIFQPEQLSNNDKEKAVVIVASITYVYEIKEQLKALGFKNIIPAYLLGFINELDFEQDRVCKNLIEDYTEHKQEYEELRAILKDEDSKKTLDAIIEFRKTFDTDVYHRIRRPLGKQYFERFVPYKSEYPFIDGGAYTGDTAFGFREFSGNNYSKIYFVEADPKTLAQGKAATKDFKNIQYCNYAISDCKKQLKFSADFNMGSKISKEGEIVVAGIDLDTLVSEDKCFIKMDIEGAEKDALSGAKRLIKNGSILAISTYHRAEDIRVLYKTILEINPEYEFYLRHYMDCVFETVLYAIPKN